MILTLSSRENEEAMASKLDEQVASRSRDDIHVFENPKRQTAKSKKSSAGTGFWLAAEISLAFGPLAFGFFRDSGTNAFVTGS
jgi:hypothetical protein